MTFLAGESQSGHGWANDDTTLTIMLDNSYSIAFGWPVQPLQPVGLGPVMESNWRRDCIRAARAREACKAGGQ